MKTITINGNNLYQTDKIVLEKVEIETPNAKITKVSIPGRNGDLDMSEALTGYVMYDNRTITVQLGIIGANQYVKTNQILMAYVGNIVKLEFSHISGYFKGRCTVKSIEQENDAHTTMVLVFDCEPFRYETEKTIKKATLNGQATTIGCPNLQMPVQPTITTTSQTTIRYKTQVLTVEKGEHLMPFMFAPNGNDIRVLTGTGDITITYQRGLL